MCALLRKIRGAEDDVRHEWPSGCMKDEAAVHTACRGQSLSVDWNGARPLQSCHVADKPYPVHPLRLLPVESAFLIRSKFRLKAL